MGKTLLPTATIDQLFPKKNGRVLWPEKVFQLPASVKRHLRKAMQQGAPKLRYLCMTLAELRKDRNRKILLWCNHPISQWTITLFCICAGVRARALSSGTTADRRAALVNRFSLPMGASEDEIRAVNAGGAPIQLLVMGFKVSAEGLNLWAQCHENLVLEPNSYYQKEYQGWCRIRRIGQTKVQRTTRLVNRETLDAQVEQAMVMNAEPIACAMQAVDRALSEESEESRGGRSSSLSILDILIGRISDKEKTRNGLAHTVLGDETHDPIHDPEIPSEIPPYLPPDDVEIFMHPEDDPDNEENWA
ncbi:MAG: hypothetical protein M1816_002029 [Peltula sp. TS41687]|nr:MAG: hypothetical protein M1816_002029 [Peltula sp. TS41687]